MAQSGGCFFRIGYYLYSRTRFGYYYHQKDIKKSREKYGEGTHTEIVRYDYGSLSITPIPMVMDNYCYLLTDNKSNKSVVIDPGHAQAVQQVLTQRSIVPEAVLNTHKHWDHSGGNHELKECFPGIPVYGGSLDNVPDATHTLTEGDTLEFGDMSFQVLFTPGHTIGHIVYLLTGACFGIPDCLFTGDQLFIGGIGRMFEAPPSTMLSSLDKILKLPDETSIWPGHEYSKDNLEFACFIDPDNVDAKKKLVWVKDRRENSLCTCPSSIGDEKSYNPFLRTHNEGILRRLGMMDTGDFESASDETRARALCLLREQKDKFKYKL